MINLQKIYINLTLLLKMNSFVIIAVSNSAAKANLGYLIKNYQIPNNKLPSWDFSCTFLSPASSPIYSGDF